MTEPEIKPCPFCGACGSSLEYDQGVGVRCHGCMSYGPEGRSKKDSVSKWNARDAGDDDRAIIKSCPFCGWGALLFEQITPPAKEAEGVFVQCSNNDCAASGPLVLSGGPEVAVFKWGERNGSGQ